MKVCQSSFLNWFIDHNIGVTVGIIVGYVAGQDSIIMAMLNRCIQPSPDKCSILIMVGMRLIFLVLILNWLQTLILI
jgi:ABC-type dipeptide/oligopeptide/nickel transport system permease subunit